MGNEWQTVPGPKSKAKAKDSKAKSGQSEGNPASTADPSNAVLAQIDADWKQSVQNGTRTANGAFAGLEVRFNRIRALSRSSNLHDRLELSSFLTILLLVLFIRSFNLPDCLKCDHQTFHDSPGTLAFAFFFSRTGSSLFVTSHCLRSWYKNIHPPYKQFTAGFDLDILQQCFLSPFTDQGMSQAPI